jgi:hypothetical protein
MINDISSISMEVESLERLPEGKVKTNGDIFFKCYT